MPKFTKEQIQTTQRVVDYLNSLHAADPLAMYLLQGHYVGCNQALADHPTCQVREAKHVGLPGTCIVGMVGVMSGMLETLGCPRVATQWTDDDAPMAERLSPKFTGFCIFGPDLEDDPAPGSIRH